MGQQSVMTGHRQRHSGTGCRRLPIASGRKDRQVEDIMLTEVCRAICRRPAVFRGGNHFTEHAAHITHVDRWEGLRPIYRPIRTELPLKTRYCSLITTALLPVLPCVDGLGRQPVRAEGLW